YVWAETPAGYGAEAFATLLLEKAGVSVAPGTAFGPHGEGHIRISLGQDTERIREAMERLKGLDF
ncbi:MAG: aminotransferase class I/II-fold pyridoxal phosphate-dependent enzyme, partial [Anaerolineae bacterium]|nr:aminotransferase class I/II-fold pyridoxal phosphate-dependent enzyme [Anaerolineae bacterium]